MGETASRAEAQATTNHEVVLQAIAEFRADISTRLGAQDTAIATATLASERAADEAAKAVTKVENMEKVLPMRFFKALDGTATMGTIVAQFATTVTKIGAAGLIVWAIFRYIVLEAIRQPPT